MNKLSELFSLQIEQRRHDEVAHSDILSLPTQRRITHMVLHFAKYVGALSQQPNDHAFQRVLVDALIIALASANSLNVNLSARIQETAKVRSYDELANLLSMTSINAKEKTFVGLAAATGVMAKACETLDHMESYDFRGTLEQRIIEITCLVLAALYALKQDFVSQIRARWEAVEKKSIFSFAENNQSVADSGTHFALVKAGSG